MEHTHHNEHHSHNETIEKIEKEAGVFEAWLAKQFAQMPHLPEGGKKFLVTVAPWLSLFFGILTLVASVGMVIISPLILLSGNIALLISIILAICTAVLSILAFDPLRKMEKKGWNFIFYTLILSVVSTFIGLIFAGLFGRFVWIFIEAYLLFEIRNMYK